MPRDFILWLLHLYQKFARPLLPNSCRFEPSCSEYMKQAVLKYGAWRGISKGAWRLLHCHPFSVKQGFDPLK